MAPGTLLVAAPASLAFGIVVQLLVARVATPRAKGVLAVLSALPALAAILALIPAVRGGGAVHLVVGPWDGPLALVIHLDGLGLLFAALGAGIGAAVLLFSVGYMAGDPGATRFYAFVLTFIGGLVGLVIAANLFLAYACWELVGLCSFCLVGFWFQDPEAVRGARKVLLMTHLAGYGLLAAIVLLYARTGTALWTDPRAAAGFTTGVFLLMLLALAAKSVQFPLHTWIPEAMAAPTPVSALLHAACYVKAGVYLAARMHALGAWPAGWGTAMVAVGTVTMVVGALCALVQGDLKRMLALSTVSQIGYMITGLGIGTPLAVSAALLHCVNHAFFKGGLFLAAGSVQHAAGSRDMDALGGLGRRMPRTTAAWLVSAGSMMGVPLMSGFTSKWMLYSAALEAGQIVPALAAWAASVATVFYCVKATSAVFLGPPSERAEHAHESPASMQWGLGLLAAGSVVLGVAPQLPLRYLVGPAVVALGLSGGGVEVTWFGLAGPTGAWWTTAGLVLALVSVAAGAVVYVVVRAPAPAPAGALAGGGVFTGGEPQPGDGRLPAGDISEMLRQHWGTLLRAVDVDRLYLTIWSGLRAVASGAARAWTRLERHAAAWTAALAVALGAGLLLAGPPAPAAERAASGFLAFPLAAACAAAGVALSVAARATRARWEASLLLLATAASVAGLLIDAPAPRLALLEGAALLALWLVWRTARTPAARSAYLAVVLLSGAGLVGGEVLLHAGDLRAARALLLAGFLVKLGAVPLALWLPRVAEEVPAVVMGLVVAVVDVAAVGELASAVAAAPWLAEPRGAWLSLALASSLIAAVLMLAERNLKRLLVLSTVEDVGFLLLGICAGDASSSGVLHGAVAHALAKALLFTCLAAPEAAGALRDDATGLAGVYPVSGAGFLVGTLAVLGVPPTLGFAGRWRLYEAALAQGAPVLAGFLVASALALVAYALALTRAWWGPAPGGEAAREPASVRGAVLALVIVLLAAGAWPAALGTFTGSLR